MIYLIVGASCSGKTSFTINSFLKNKTFEIKHDLMDYTECDDCILIGRYDGDKRSKGTDTILRTQISSLGEQVSNLLNLNKDIVLEGDKIVSKDLFNYLLSLNVPIKLYLINVHPDVSYLRNVANGSTSSRSHLRAVTSKAKNIYNEYFDRMMGEVVDTSSLSREDFNNLSKDNLPSVEDDNLFV